MSFAEWVQKNEEVTEQILGPEGLMDHINDFKRLLEKIGEGVRTITHLIIDITLGNKGRNCSVEKTDSIRSSKSKRILLSY